MKLKEKINRVKFPSFSDWHLKKYQWIQEKYINRDRERLKNKCLGKFSSYQQLEALFIVVSLIDAGWDVSWEWFRILCVNAD